MRDIRYLTDHYTEKIARVNEIGAPLNFVFITDMHAYINRNESRVNGLPYESVEDHIRSIQYILDRCPGIGFVVTGGDVGNDYAESAEEFKQTYRFVYEELYRLSVPVHNITGNHDDGVGNCVDHGWDQREHTMNGREMHKYLSRYNPTDKNYYYIDDEKNGFRFVFLDSSDHVYLMDEDHKYPFHWVNEISIRQCEWLENEALKTDKKIIVFNHQPLHNGHMLGEGLPLGVKPYDDMINGPRVAYAVHHCPNVVAVIAGHLHADNMYYDDKVLCMTTLCSLVQKWCPGLPERKIGTVTETAFDVISIKDSVLYATRFGAGYDRMAQLMYQRGDGRF